MLPYGTCKITSFITSQNLPSGYTLPHPNEIADSFRPGVSRSGPYKVKHNTRGLLKLLMYGDYVKAQAAARNVTVQSVMEADLKRYPYKTASTFKVLRTIQT